MEINDITISHQGMDVFLDYNIEENEIVSEKYLQMINNHGDYFVPCQILSNTILRYDISYSMTLKKYLTGVLSKESILKIFKSIAGAFGLLRNDDTLMHNILLDTDYIFVDFMNHNLRLVALPLSSENSVHMPELMRFFRELLFEVKLENAQDCEFLVDIFRVLISHNETDIRAITEGLGNISAVQAPREPVKIRRVEMAQSYTAPAAEPLQTKAESIYQNTMGGPVPSYAEVPLQTGPESTYQNTMGDPVPSRAEAPVPNRHVLNKSVPKNEDATVLVSDAFMDNENVVHETVNRNQSNSFYENNTYNFGRQPVEEQMPNPHLIRLGNGEIIYLTEQGVNIGSSPKRGKGDVYLINNNPAVAKFHVSIFRKDGVFFVTNMTRNKITFYNGNPMSYKEQQLLLNDARLTIGDEIFVFRLFNE